MRPATQVAERNFATRSRLNRLIAQWWRSQSVARQDRFATFGPLASVVLFLGAIILAFWYLRNEEFQREQDSVKRDTEIAQQQIRLRLIENQEQLVRIARDIVTRVIDQAVVESNERRPGSEAVLERLSEMMFVDAARRYLDSLPEDATGWLAGLRDRFVGKTLELMHEQPARDWTIDDLAREIGLSRSALHERFVQYVGQPPMQYLASWRIQLGSRLLRESNRNVATIALEVGYDSEAAFSRAFRRMVGTPPAAWRRARAAA